ncbi:unnamed protein product [Larinioides sclopetarius]|uniref:CRAL-TRIO domain-containing protein n=1 Tax=Larinioides sclopetarius TaxID=280406 RepID=A0AAV2A3X8_9ARAC
MSSKPLKIQGKEFLPLETGYLTESAIRKCKEELNETPERKAKRIEELRSLLEGNVKSEGIDFNDDFLVGYLRRNKYRLKDAQRQMLDLIDLYETENVFGSVPDEYLDLPSSKFVNLLPFRCQDECAVLIFRWGKWDPSELPIERLKQTIVMVVCQALRDPMTQINGFKVIYDLDGLSYKHWKYFTPHNLFLFYNGIVNCSPARYKEVYIINENILLKLIWRVIKPVMSEKIKSRIRFLSNPEELLDYFPRCIMSSEYGGDILEADIKDWIKRANKEQQKFTLRGQPNYY